MVPAGGPVVGSRYDGISGAGQCQICPFLSFLEGRILEKWAVVEGQSGIAPPEKARRRGANGSAPPCASVRMVSVTCSSDASRRGRGPSPPRGQGPARWRVREGARRYM